MEIPRRHFFPALTAAPALARQLTAEIGRMELVSTHEHLYSEAERLERKPDFFALAEQYLGNDMVSAGMPAEPRPKSWAEFEPYWRQARLTGYGQALRIAMRELYGVEDLNAVTLAWLNAAIAEATRPGLYERVLRQRAGYRYAVLDDFWHGDPKRPAERLFVLARKMDWFSSAAKASDIRRMEKVTGVAINDVGGLKRAVERRLEQSLAEGMVTLKTTLAYNRPLRFEMVSEAEAQADFDRLMKEPQASPPRRLSDHIFHHVLELAEAHRLPLQVHAGLQAGNANTLANSRALALENLFTRYRKVTFDLFHLGWPWVEETAALAKMHPNVTIDFCWAHVVSPVGARAALDMLLECVPLNKIMGYGGDYQQVELSYGHSRMARRNIAEVLAAKVQAGLCSETEAVEIARQLLSENAARLFPARR